jgi:hypothetical protein
MSDINNTTFDNNNMGDDINPRMRHKVRGMSYNMIEDLSIAKSFIEASEDSVVGSSQKGPRFKQTMYLIYLRRLEEIYETDLRFERSATLEAQSEMARLNGGYLHAVRYPPRTSKSIFDRWKTLISPQVSKFIGIEEVTDMESGGDDETHYQACNKIYTNRYPKFGSFDSLKLVKEYLSNKAKWISWRAISEDNSTRVARPIGNKKAVRQQHDERVVRSAILNLNTPQSNGNDSGITVASTTAEDDRSVFYTKGSSALETMGVAALQYIQQQHQLVQQATQASLLAMMDSPNRRLIVKEQFESLRAEVQINAELKRENAQILLLETRAKRIRLERESEMMVRIGGADPTATNLFVDSQSPMETINIYTGNSPDKDNDNEDDHETVDASLNLLI